MMPCTETARLTVKNTFLNWQDEDEDLCRADAFSSRRAFKTCPDLQSVTTKLPEQEGSEPVAVLLPCTEIRANAKEQQCTSANIAGVARPLRRRGRRGGEACRKAHRGIQQQQEADSGRGQVRLEKEEMVVTCVRQAEASQQHGGVLPRRPSGTLCGSNLDSDLDLSHVRSDVSVPDIPGLLSPRDWPSLFEGVPAKGSSPDLAVEASQPLEIAFAKKAARVAPSSISKAGLPPQPWQRCSQFQGRLWCHLYLNPEMLRPGFDLNKKIIGHGGCCTRRIHDATGAKIRLRGRGSGHLEGEHEAPAPLMLAITGEKGKAVNFCRAIQMSADLLHDISKRFRSFCDQRGRKQRGEQQRCSGQPPVGPSDTLFWVGEISVSGAGCAASTLEDLSLSLPGAKQRSLHPAKH